MVRLPMPMMTSPLTSFAVSPELPPLMSEITTPSALLYPSAAATGTGEVLHGYSGVNHPSFPVGKDFL